MWCIPSCLLPVYIPLHSMGDYGPAFPVTPDLFMCVYSCVTITPKILSELFLVYFACHRWSLLLL